jgi:hypothetical protein
MRETPRVFGSSFQVTQSTQHTRQRLNCSRYAHFALGRHSTAPFWFSNAYIGLLSGVKLNEFLLRRTFTCILTVIHEMGVNKVFSFSHSKKKKSQQTRFVFSPINPFRKLIGQPELCTKNKHLLCGLKAQNAVKSEAHFIPPFKEFMSWLYTPLVGDVFIKFTQAQVYLIPPVFYLMGLLLFWHRHLQL